jgi:predicted hotdog family 3-hydroxylacyl-ACP dehydratase
MVLSRDAIAGLIPHGGSMCLLHEVLHVDDEGITCRAISHRDADHPLREEGILPALSGIEYAAQAMAVHGALRESRGPRPGVLAAVRDVVLNVERLDDIPDDLVLTARRLLDDRNRLLYEFEVRAGARELMRGRAVVVLGTRDAS